MLRFALVLTLLVTACKNNNDAAPAAPPSSPEPGSSAAPAPGGTHGAPAGSSATAAQTPPRPLQKLSDGRVVLGPFTAVVPSDWLEKPSTSSMRAAQFQLPAASGEAEVIVYYFGESGAGNVQDNINRWLSQFKQPDGKPSSEVAKIEKVELAGREGTIVSVSGRYVAPAMPGGEPSDKPDQALLAAIVPSPRGPYYFRLIGSEAAVSASAPRFREMLGSLKLQ